MQQEQASANSEGNEYASYTSDPAISPGRIQNARNAVGTPGEVSH